MIVLASLVAVPIKTFAQTPTVIFSEIAWAGSSHSSSDEWIELTNLTDTPIDLSNWTITGAGSSGKDLVVPDDAVIEPYSTFLIANYDSSHDNSALNVKPNFTTATLSLPNDGFRAALYDHDGSLIDVAGGDGAAFAGRSGSAADTDDGRYRSMVRTNETLSGSDEAAWSDAQTASGFKQDVEDMGTPRAVESWFIQETEEAAEELIEEETLEGEMEEVVGEEISDNETEEVVEETPQDTDESPSEGAESSSETSLEPNEIEETEEGTEEESVTDSETMSEENDAPQEVPEGAEAGETDSPEESSEDLENESSKENTPPERSSEPEEDVPTTTIAFSPGVMQINEFVVDPNEGEEWIEIVNRSTESIDTTGWTVEDATGRATELEPVAVASGSYIVVEGPRGKLNNDTDTILLLDAARTVIDSITYGGEDLPAPKDGDSLARDSSGSFTLTNTTTPGGPNVIAAASETSTETESEAVEDEPEEPIDEDEAETSQEEVVEDEVPDSGSTENTDTEPDSSDEESAPEQEDSKIGETTYSGAITLEFTSLYPNTSGADAQEEYIEITNTGLESVDLKGWSIEDGSTDRYTFPDTLEIAGGSTLRVDRPQSTLSLNNSGDTLELITPDGDVIDMVTYGSAPQGGTYDRDGAYWSWSTTETTTKKSAVETSEVVATKKTTPTQDTTTSSSTTSSTTNTSSSTQYVSTASYVSFFSIEQAKAQPDNTRVRIEGYVTASPGTFGRQVMYLQDESAGIQVYFYAATFPELDTGTRVRIEGVMSTAYGERRVKVTDATNIVPTGDRTQATPAQHDAKEFDEALVGLLIKTSGQILSRSSTKLVLEDGPDRVTIYLKSDPFIDANQFERGDQLTVTGILTSYNGELRLRPRAETDLHIEESAAVTFANTSQGGKALLNQQQSRMGVTIILVVTTVLAALALMRKLPRRRERAAA